ncbi:MAG: helix-hairpin-helix domain-containing protein [Clostridiaceae bacterium]|nr:helix-hairpin-helix domain-containing protein [Clostridiaceae bacterium]
MKKKYKTTGIIALGIIILMYAVVTYINGGEKQLKKNNNESIFVEEEKDKDKSISNGKEEIVVEIKGEISKPDIYYLDEGSIVQDLINKAGGVTPNADLATINRAEELVNHESILIPNKNQVEESVGGQSKGAEQEKNTKVNINKATTEEFQTLNGIGETKAKAIVSYRENNGKFKKIEDIKNVTGIGGKLYDKIKDSITI